ncbi:MAG: biotin/lipoyl-containing protein, partial [Xanthobacteraceae bacterium]
MTEIRVPTLGESVTEATIGKWFKKAGEAVAVDEPLVELETDKVTIEVPAPAAGVLSEIAAKDGETVAVGAVLGQIKDGAGAAKGAATPAADKPAAAPPPQAAKTSPPTKASAPAKAASAPAKAAAVSASAKAAETPLAPSVRKLSAESGIDAGTVPGSGKDSRVTKGDMLAAIERAAAQPTPVAATAATVQV